MIAGFGTLDVEEDNEVELAAGVVLVELEVDAAAAVGLAVVVVGAEEGVVEELAVGFTGIWD